MAPFAQILQLPAVIGGFVKWSVFGVLVRERYAEAVAALHTFLFMSLLCRVRVVAAFAGLAKPVSLYGLGEDDAGRAFMFQRGLIGRVDLLRIVAAARQLGKLLIGEMLDELQQFGVFAEEMLADV